MSFYTVHQYVMTQGATGSSRDRRERARTTTLGSLIVARSLRSRLTRKPSVTPRYHNALTLT